MAERESIGNTLRVALGVCLVCAVVVSTAAVSLRPYQAENRLAFRQLNILQTAGLYEPGMDVSAAFERIERRFVELDSGEYVEREDDFDPLRAARDPSQSINLGGEDEAGIRRRSDVAEVFIARDADGGIERVILPVHGYGLWSTMFGFLALEPDLNTVAGIGFYEHGETPGLGGEIENPRWQANWEGKRLFDEQGRFALRVERGQVPDGASNLEHRVDGISGATLTTRGVNNMLRFWLGERGYGPYLERLGQRIDAGEES